MTTAQPWTHDRIQSEFARRRRKARHTLVITEAALPKVDGGRLDVVELISLPTRLPTRLHIVGYEVKANAGDLARDLAERKWTKYLTGVDELWFVLGPGLDADSVPDTAGVVQLRGPAFCRLRKPEPLTRKSTDTEVWRTIAHHYYHRAIYPQWPPRAGSQTRAERMLAFANMKQLGHVLNGRVRHEVATALGGAEHLKAREERLAADIERHRDDIERAAAARAELTRLGTVFNTIGRNLGSDQLPAALRRLADNIEKGRDW